MSVSARQTAETGGRRRPGAETGLGLDGGVATLVGVVMLAAGVWAVLWPAGWVDVVGFGRDEDLVGDLGAFQLGFGLGLLLALLWRDALATMLAAFLTANLVQLVHHAVDLAVGGRAAVPGLLGVLSTLTALAFWLRLRRLGYVLGRVRPAPAPNLARFVEQKTIRLETYRRTGAAVPTPVSIAVDGDRAVVRTFEKAGKTRRLRRDPAVRFAPCTFRGAPTGPAIRGRARRLNGPEARAAAGLLRRKYPLLHGVLVPLAHRVGRAKTGRSVFFELLPDPADTPDGG